MSDPTAGPGPYGSPGPYVPQRPPVPPAGPYATAFEPFAPAPVSPRSTRPLVIAAILLAMAVIVAGSYLVGRLTAPTLPTVATSTAAVPSASPRASPSGSGAAARAGFTLTGSTLSGPGFSARMPSGWTLAPENGTSATDGVIENGADNSLAYFASDPTSAATRCFNAIDTYRVKLGGTVVDLPSVRWGNGTAVAKELDTKYSTGQRIGLDIYCVDRPGNTSAAILSVADPNHKVVNKAAAEALLASWVWS